MKTDTFFNEEIITKLILNQYKSTPKRASLLNSKNITPNSIQNFHTGIRLTNEDSQPESIQDIQNFHPEIDSIEKESQSGITLNNQNLVPGEKSNEENYESKANNEKAEYPFIGSILFTESTDQYVLDITSIMDAKTFVFHILYAGLTPSQAIRFLNHLGIKTYGKSRIYSAQNEIAFIIIKLAEESMNYHRHIMPQGISLSFDGAWSHVRHALQHTAVIIESLHHKIVF